MAAKIIGTGSYLPKQIITNNNLSTFVDTSDEWISTRTGIRERRIAKEETTSYLATNAALNAINDAGIDPLDIDLIIVGTMSGDYYLPSTACEVQNEIKAMNALCFDISAACTGFVCAYNTAEAYINAGLSKTALIIGSDTMSKLIDWKDRATCVLFGDGAGAAILKLNNEASPSYSVMGSDGSKKDMLICKTRSHNNLQQDIEEKPDYIKMNGGEVFKFAVKKVPESIEQLLEKSNVALDEIKYFILHQANSRILQAIAKKLNVEESKFPMNLDKYGNTSAASIPILLDELNKEGKLQHGDKIILSGFGGGLSWGSILLEW
ncbi:beta-ketoacyl-ACP synthase III [Anaeromicropila herbilytica]|uniref:Beta-ketoacyl-[acyl-carrier-protein] synthase III n=1 Tax=Anaeromicropila herbilytica TaxID=2785025 RepID=A0A7R7IAR5_9FIRM|nr:beta-ketoacyl-ACP synthase III [Anaeromicropila herbilytica]BCN28717.1 3-oxoacyl-[acyl-carrier-protein] synthase 3 [Anaeromicropila herbilytica]